MFKSLTATALVASFTRGLQTTKLDVASLYRDVVGDVMLAQTRSSAFAQGNDPLCTFRVHSVLPNVDIPKLPQLNYDENKEIPDFLRARLARRYEERGEPVPDYLQAPGSKSVEVKPAAVTPTLRAPLPTPTPTTTTTTAQPAKTFTLKGQATTIAQPAKPLTVPTTPTVQKS